MLTKLHVYIDGSFRPQTGLGGAGIYFPTLIEHPDNDKDVKKNGEEAKKEDDDEADCQTRFSIPVPPALHPPCPLDTKMDAVRAELYAALACVHIVTRQFLQPLTSLQLVVHVDSLIALILLEYVQKQPMCFSRMLTARANRGEEMHLDFNWEGGHLEGEEVWKYADILDYWWLYTHDVPSHQISYAKVRAHTLDVSLPTTLPTTTAQDNKTAGQQKAEETKKNGRPTTASALYNEEADKLAKQASWDVSLRHLENLADLAQAGFPLFNYWVHAEEGQLVVLEDGPPSSSSSASSSSSSSSSNPTRKRRRGSRSRSRSPQPQQAKRQRI